jgi:bifunctional non-homologous end joining protein LigD
MTTQLPERASLSRGLVLDGELVAFSEDGAPHWPLLYERVLHGNRSLPVTFVAFDVLRVDGHDVMVNPWEQRRGLLEGSM